MEFFDDVFELVESALDAGSLKLPEVVAVCPSRMIWILFGIGEEDEIRALNVSPAITCWRCVGFSGPLPGELEWNLWVS